MPSNPHKEDKQLVSACVTGEPKAWEAFVEQYDRLLRAVVRKTGQLESNAGYDADDVVNYVYEKLLENDYRRLTAWQGRAKLSTYLVLVSRNLCLDFVRKHRKGTFVEPTDDIPDDQTPPPGTGDSELRSVRREALAKAIEELPAKQALIMRLRLEGKSLREIATITNRPVGTISVENSRALKKLEKILKQTLTDGDADMELDGF